MQKTFTVWVQVEPTRVFMVLDYLGLKSQHTHTQRDRGQHQKFRNVLYTGFFWNTENYY